MTEPTTTSEEELWVICPVCHKPNPAGTRYCEHCWGAVIHPGVTLTSEEVEEATRHRQAYLKRRKILRIASIVAGALVIPLIVFLILLNFTDVVAGPPENVNSNSLPGDWAMFQHDAGHTGSAGAVALPKGTQKWVFSTGAPIRSSPAVAGSSVYIGSQDHKFYSFDAETGTENWEYETGSWVESSPVVVNDTVYFGSNDSWVYAFDAKNGEQTWAFKTNFPVKSAPAVADGIIYVGSDDYYLYALDEATGKKIWDFDVGSPVWSTPVVDNGIIYIGSADGFTYALHSKSGQKRLRFKSHYAVYSGPVVEDKTVYVVTNNGFLYAFEGDARTKWREHEIRPLWTQLYLMGLPGVSKPPTQSGFLWSKNLDAAATSSPTLVDNILYIGLENKLVAIDLRSRQILWEFETGGIVRSSPAIAGSAAFVGSEDGKLYAVDTASGKKLWDFDTGDKITSSPAVVDGVVYVGSNNGNLYAIE